MNTYVLQVSKKRKLNFTSGSVQGIENRIAMEGRTQGKSTHWSHQEVIVR